MFEVVVRPVVFPDIRPPAPGRLAPADDPAKGIATLSGAGGRLIDLPHSWSSSVHRANPHREQERTYDKARIYQRRDDGTINKANFVDVEQMKKLKTIDRSGNNLDFEFAPYPTPDNVEVLERDLTRTNPEANSEASQ